MVQSYLITQSTTLQIISNTVQYTINNYIYKNSNSLYTYRSEHEIDLILRLMFTNTKRAVTVKPPVTLTGIF